MRPAVGLATVVLAWLGLLNWELVTLTVSTLGLVLGAIGVVMSGHALRIAKKVQQDQAARLDALGRTRAQRLRGD